MNETKEYRYKFHDITNGFVIDGGDDRTPVEITLDEDKTYFKIRTRNKDYPAFDIGLFETHKMLSQCGTLLMQKWRPKDLSRKGNSYIINWARKQAAKAVSPIVAQKMRELRSAVPENILLVQRKYFAATTYFTDLLRIKQHAIYNDKYFLKDIEKYRAAALSINQLVNEFDFHEDENFFGSSKKVYREIDLSNWMSMYSCEPDKKVYRSLALTLQNLPGRILPNMLSNLTSIHLERPITDRLELSCLLCSDTRTDNNNGRNKHNHILQNAKRSELKRAFELVGRTLHQKYTGNKIKEIFTVMRYITDYPETHNGNVVGLTEKSIIWHREAHTRRLEASRMAANVKLAQPPVTTPIIPGIKLLTTAGELLAEGQQMYHCVGNYVAECIRGNSFIFHVDYKDEMATVEVNNQGRVMQSHGPYNKDNKASVYGQRQLSKWGLTFKENPGIVNYVDDSIPF